MVRPRRLLHVLVGALAAFATSVSTAAAGALVASAPDCTTQTASQVFLPWLDPMFYVLAPGGNFERTSWSTTGAAKMVAGNEPFYVGSVRDRSSLALPEGSSAQSKVMCVGIDTPTVRFFARQTDGGLHAHLDVSVLWEDSAGNVVTTQIAAAGAPSTWSPTATHPVLVNLLPLLPGEHTPVAFRVAADGGSFQIDDFYVDPYGRS